MIQSQTSNEPAAIAVYHSSFQKIDSLNPFRIEEEHNSLVDPLHTGSRTSQCSAKKRQSLVLSSSWRISTIHPSASDMTNNCVPVPRSTFALQTISSLNPILRAGSTQTILSPVQIYTRARASPPPRRFILAARLAGEYIHRMNPVRIFPL